jgi:hypothetical protein
VVWSSQMEPPPAPPKGLSIWSRTPSGTGRRCCRMGASALAGGPGSVVVVGRLLLVLLRLLLGLGTVVELAGASERLVGEAVEVVGAGGLVVRAGAGAAAGR